MNEPHPVPDDVTVDSVDWLPSGARSGLVRVRGHRSSPGELPELVLEIGGQARRFKSLPDPRVGRDRTAWRGAYVLDARPVAEADRLWIEFPGGGRLPLAGLEVPAEQVGEAPEAAPPEIGGEVVDRAVLAERRARRAEAAEQAQARIAHEAMRAVEVLELRSHELEERMAAALVERDELRAQVPEAAPAPEIDPRVFALENEVRRLRTALAVAAERPEPVIDAGNAERRAARLRTALTTTIGTIAELRMRLHEADVARRTREIGHSADAVQLAMLLQERAGVSDALDAARDDLLAAQSARDEALSARVQAETALADLEERLDVQAAELAGARERVAQLEADVAAAEIELDRAVTEAIASAQLEAEADAAERADERIAAADALTAEAERALDDLRDRLDEAETARELAEAAALAAAAERRAASVASAAAVDPQALRDQLDRARRDLQAAREAADAPEAVPEPDASGLSLAPEAEAAPDEAAAEVPAVAEPPAPDIPEATPAEALEADAADAVEDSAAQDVAEAGAHGDLDALIRPEDNRSFSPPRAPIAQPTDEVLAAAEAQARAAAEGEPVTEERDKVVADLDAAADALRRPTIVSPASEPPSDVARGRGARAYPALRGAIVKLAHDDPAAAGRLLVGLLGAQHAVLSEPLDYDLSIAEIGTYAVRSGDGETLVTALEKPRGRTHAAFHLRGNALDLAELLAGVGDRPRRMRGAIRASGRVRDARRLAVGMDTGVGLADLLAAGADPDPDVVLRGFTYAVRPPWTSGQTWTVELVVDGRPFTVSARHSGGLTTHDGAHDGEPDARLRVSGQGFRDLVAGVEQPLRVEGDEAIVARLLSLVERARALGTE